MIGPNLAALAYLAAGALFVLALRGLSSPASARSGALAGMAGMVLALATTAALAESPSARGIILAIGAVVVGAVPGAFIARKVAMASMPQLVAAFHSLVGLAATFVAFAAFLEPQAFGLGAFGAVRPLSMLEMGLGAAIGAATFSGSIIAFGKLQGLVSSAPVLLPGRHALNLALGAGSLILIAAMCLAPATQTIPVFVVMVALALVLGATLIIPIGGADMPVVVSMLNSYSGWAAAGVGLTLSNMALIITGALVGASGAILSYIMCRAMNRSFVSVILGGFGAEAEAASGAAEARPVKQGAPADAAFILANAGSVIIVPGYGMAVAQAQHALRDLADAVKAKGAKVAYAVHPVAGRMPGHMNVLLAEANIPYDEVFELEDVNAQFPAADVALVLGANDVTNPAARSDPQSPIFGMPILDVDKARATLFIKRSLAPGYAGIDNALFYADGTMMLFGDARKVVEEIVKAF